MPIGIQKRNQAVSRLWAMWFYSLCFFYWDSLAKEQLVLAEEATRTASVYTRVDPETKEQAELILAKPETNTEQFNAERRAGLDDIQADRVVSTDDVEAEMRRMYGA